MRPCRDTEHTRPPSSVYVYKLDKVLPEVSRQIGIITTYKLMQAKIKQRQVREE